MIEKINELGRKYEESLRLLLDKCTKDYERCHIYSKIGINYSHVLHGNKYLTEYIDFMLDEGHRYDTIYLDEVVDFLEDRYDANEIESVFKYFADNRIKSIYLDW